MLDAAVKALSQILSPPMRTILWRSIGLALVLITVLVIGLQRLFSWFAEYGEGWAEGLLGPGFHTSLNALSWIVSIAAGLGVALGGIFLMPAITSLIASVFVDDVADHVERKHYPAEKPGDALPLGVAIPEGVKTALLTILVYLVALPFVLFAGAGFLIFFIATAWLLGREYFELAAMRFRSPAEAKAMRKDNAAAVFTAGLFIAAFVSIPIVNLATPLFGMAFMVHMHKRLSGPRPELIEPGAAVRDAGGVNFRLTDSMGAAHVEDLVRYLDEIVEPTVEEYHRNPLSVRHAFIACVVTFHAIDYLAYPKSSRGLRQQFGNASPDFKLVDHVAHAFKHVVSGNPGNPNLKSEDVIKRKGAFAAGAFSPLAFDVGAVTISDRPKTNLLRTVKNAVKFLRDYKPAA